MKKLYLILIQFNRNPELKLAYNNRGLVKYYLKQYDGAIDDFNNALRIQEDKVVYRSYSTDKYAYNNMANCYYALGKLSEACKYWQTALDLGYSYKPGWKEEYGIDDPADLIKQHCK